MRCPSCRSEDVRRSRNKKSLLGVVQRWRGLRRFRCRECRRIFYGQPSPADREIIVKRSRRAREHSRSHAKPPHKPALRRHATELVLFLCLVVIFYAALKYLTHVH